MFLLCDPGNLGTESAKWGWEGWSAGLGQTHNLGADPQPGSRNARQNCATYLLWPDLAGNPGKVP